MVLPAIFYIGLIIILSFVIGFLLWKFPGIKDRIFNKMRELLRLPIEDISVLYHFDEVSGTKTEDASGHGNHGTFGDGNCNLHEGSCPDWNRIDKSPIGGGALRFDIDTDDDIDDYVHVKDSDSLDPKSGVGIDFWIKLYANINCNPDVVNKGNTYRVTLGRDGKFTVRISGRSWTNPTPISLGHWSHVAVTFDNSTGIGKTFINGVEDKSSQPGKFVFPVNANDLIIGKNSTSCTTSRKDDFSLDELRIYNRPLTPEEIVFHYQGIY